MTRLAILLLSKDDFNDSIAYGMFAITLVMTRLIMTRSLVTSLGLSMRLVS